MAHKIFVVNPKPETIINNKENVVNRSKRTLKRLLSQKIYDWSLQSTRFAFLFYLV